MLPVRDAESRRRQAGGRLGMMRTGSTARSPRAISSVDGRPKHERRDAVQGRGNLRGADDSRDHDVGPIKHLGPGPPDHHEAELLDPNLASFSLTNASAGSSRGSVYFTRPSASPTTRYASHTKSERTPSRPSPTTHRLHSGRGRHQSTNRANEVDSIGDSRRPDACSATLRAAATHLHPRMEVRVRSRSDAVVSPRANAASARTRPAAKP